MHHPRTRGRISTAPGKESVAWNRQEPQPRPGQDRALPRPLPHGSQTTSSLGGVAAGHDEPREAPDSHPSPPGSGRGTSRLPSSAVVSPPRWCAHCEASLRQHFERSKRPVALSRHVQRTPPSEACLQGPWIAIERTPAQAWHRSPRMVPRYTCEKPRYRPAIF